MTHTQPDSGFRTIPGPADPSSTRLCGTAFALALVFLTAQPAAAAEIKPLRVGSWTGGAYTNDQTGAFSHCAASAEYRSGIVLLFSVTRDQQWSMGFSKPSWQLTPGKEYPVQYKVDRGRVLEGTAVARSKSLAQVMLPAKNNLFHSFRRGKILRVGAAQEVLEFALTGTSRMLSRLLRCSERYKNYAAADPFRKKSAGNPFQGQVRGQSVCKQRSKPDGSRTARFRRDPANPGRGAIGSRGPVEPHQHRLQNHDSGGKRRTAQKS